MFVTVNLLDQMIVNNARKRMRKRENLTNGSFKDGIEIGMKLVVTETRNFDALLKYKDISLI
jgi:hypothetical protein